MGTAGRRAGPSASWASWRGRRAAALGAARRRVAAASGGRGRAPCAAARAGGLSISSGVVLPGVEQRLVLGGLLPRRGGVRVDLVAVARERAGGDEPRLVVARLAERAVLLGLERRVLHRRLVDDLGRRLDVGLRGAGVRRAAPAPRRPARPARRRAPRPRAWRPRRRADVRGLRRRGVFARRRRAARLRAARRPAAQPLRAAPRRAARALRAARRWAARPRARSTGGDASSRGSTARRRVLARLGGGRRGLLARLDGRRRGLARFGAAARRVLARLGSRRRGFLARRRGLLLVRERLVRLDVRRADGVLERLRRERAAASAPAAGSAFSRGASAVLSCAGLVRAFAEHG